MVVDFVSDQFTVLTSYGQYVIRQGDEVKLLIESGSLHVTSEKAAVS
jgi:hypothetical protein